MLNQLKLEDRMADKIIIEKKTKYGNELFYPVCDKAKAFADLMGSVTLPDHKLKQIKRNLGFEIELKQESLNF
tara:strand:+ start:214 stop:432 length:219 start_codon:yes stop_codon:yes gene_type:complete